jgi:redox-sensitive bicupin YhaK (pirin superfamily)
MPAAEVKNDESGKARALVRTIPAQATSDGAGVRLYRSLGSAPALRWDPFLMLDEFASEDPREYLGGFPAHPHRGFETVTYMLDGRMRHEDSMGNRGDLGPGDVQWMSAARGIIHSEMPQQQEGRMRGFQLWINLPAREKMRPAWYRDVPAAQIAQAALDGGGTARVILGALRQGATRTSGPVQVDTAASLYADIHLPAGASCRVPVAEGDTGLLYVYEGDLEVGDAAAPLARRHTGLLDHGPIVAARAGAQGARFLLLTGIALAEPIVQVGPFVMNTREQIERAIADYQAGTLAS